MTRVLTTVPLARQLPHPTLLLIWEPRDCWLGLFWDRTEDPGDPRRQAFILYVCIVPCLPVCLVVPRARSRWPEAKRQAAEPEIVGPS